MPDQRIESKSVTYLPADQFTKDATDRMEITFQGQNAEDELANEIYYMASGDFKRNEDYAMAESVDLAVIV